MPFIKTSLLMMNTTTLKDYCSLWLAEDVVSLVQNIDMPKRASFAWLGLRGGELQAARGPLGSWGAEPWARRIAHRRGNAAEFKFSSLGFRIARNLK